MNEPALLSIYAASAGSGKTYTLAKEYIKLLLAKPDPFYFKHILAVTFTNDAANEMKARVLQYLEQIANQNIAELPLAQRIFEELTADGKGITEEVLQQRADRAFKQIVHDYADFSIQTIDSFINRIVSAFAFPLGLLGNFEIVLDAEELLVPAVENLLSKIGNDLDLVVQNNLVAFQVDKADKGNSWNRLSTDLVAFASNLFSEKNLRAIEKVKALHAQTIVEVKQNIDATLERHRQTLLQLAGNIVEICQQKGLEIEDFNGISNGILSMFQRKANGDKLFDSLTPTTISTLNLEKKLYTDAKKSDFEKLHKNQIIDSIADQLLQLANYFENYREKNQAFYEVFSSISQNLTYLSLFKTFQTELELIKERDGQIHISEFNKLVFSQIINSPVPFIYERVGVKYAHIMIDEFQDTSNIQFQNFLPLLSNCLAENGQCLLVGDPKQGIYSFRGGDYRQLTLLSNSQLDKIAETFHFEENSSQNLADIGKHIALKNLQVNYRSSRQIIEFNNDLFGYLAQNETLRQRLPMLDEVYANGAKQHCPPNAMDNGHVEVQFVDNKQSVENNFEGTDAEHDETDEQIDAFFYKIHEAINQSLELGYQLGDMAVLCRQKKDAYAVAKYLTDHQIPVVSAESVLIAFSGAVQLLEAFLKLLHEDTSMHRYECVSLVHLHLAKQNLPNDVAATSSLLGASKTEFLQYFKQYGIDFGPLANPYGSLYEYCHNVIQILGLHQLYQHDYLAAFLDQVLKFEQNHGNNLPDFLEFWQLNKAKLAIVLDAANAVVVNTIHKAKGLEYKVVILPYAQWKLGLRSSEMLWVETDDLPNGGELQGNTYTEKMEVALVKHHKKLYHEGLIAQLNEAEQNTTIEAMNLLYVALTRAKNRLYILCTLSTKWKGALVDFGSVADILYNYLVEKKLYSDQSLKYILAENLQELPQKPLVASSQVYFDQDMARLLTMPAIKAKKQEESPAQSTGNLLHEALAEIMYTEEINKVLGLKKLAGRISDDEAQIIENQLNVALNHPLIAEYFVRPAIAKNELEIIGADTLHRADRVVFTKDKTAIIDYKSGLQEAKHEVQIRNYGQLLAKIGYQNIHLFLMYILDNKVIEVKL